MNYKQPMSKESENLIFAIVCDLKNATDTV